MDDLTEETEVFSVEYAGPHSTKPGLFEIALHVKGGAGGRRSRLCLLFRPAEAMLLAHMLQRSPPQTEPEDHTESDIARLST